MIILLAESKTMSGELLPQTPESLAAATPVFEEKASLLMHDLSEMPIDEIAEGLGVSHQLAVKAHNYAYDFSFKSTGNKALYSFTGEAFRALDAKTLSVEAVDKATKDLKFISSVYGFLNAGDIIKPYRFEFNKPLAPGNLTSIQYYKSLVTSHVVNLIKEEEVTEIINLLPGDADKCIDWKIVKAFIKVYKICFQNVGGGEKLTTPYSKRIKELRGSMARTILMENIETFKDLTEHPTADFIYSPDYSKPGLPIFICD